MKDYYQFLLDYIEIKKDDAEKYSLLLQYLYSKPYRSRLAADCNMIPNSLSLRDQYSPELDASSCTMLEAMVRLAKKGENALFRDPREDEQADRWFWKMVDSLGLTSSTNGNFSIDVVDSLVECYLNGDYEPDGHGGLFYIPGYKGDMRTLGAWNQFLEYANYILFT